jgi:hypothetical protein
MVATTRARHNHLVMVRKDVRLHPRSTHPTCPRICVRIRVCAVGQMCMRTQLCLQRQRRAVSAHTLNSHRQHTLVQAITTCTRRRQPLATKRWRHRPMVVRVRALLRAQCRRRIVMRTRQKQAIRTRARAERNNGSSYLILVYCAVCIFEICHLRAKTGLQC